MENRKLKTAASVTLAVVSIGVLAYVIARHTVLAEPSTKAESRHRPAIDAETLKVFPDFQVADGSVKPWKNPDTGKNTLYPGEPCYWTKDGKASLEPHYVLLNEYVGKPGETKCPVCGRKVVFHNPLPPPELMLEAAKREGKVKGG